MVMKYNSLRAVYKADILQYTLRLHKQKCLILNSAGLFSSKKFDRDIREYLYSTKASKLGQLSHLQLRTEKLREHTV